jgi:hypothetical protein
MAAACIFLRRAWLCDRQRRASPRHPTAARGGVSPRAAEIDREPRALHSRPVRAAERFDALIQNILERSGIPGASLAMARGGRLVGRAPEVGGSVNVPDRALRQRRALIGAIFILARKRPYCGARDRQSPGRALFGRRGREPEPGRPRSARADPVGQWRDHEIRIDPAGTRCQRVGDKELAGVLDILRRRLLATGDPATE